MEILLNPPFAVDVVLKAFFIAFYYTSQIEFQLGFGPAQLDDNSMMTVLQNCLPPLPELLNSFSLPEFLKKLSAQPGWSSPLPAQLSVNWDGLLLHL